MGTANTVATDFAVNLGTRTRDKPLSLTLKWFKAFFGKVVRTEGLVATWS